VISTDIDVSALKELQGRVLSAVQADSLLREISVSMLGVIQKRIHTDGKKADGSNIGTYSDGYLKQRIKNKNLSDPKVVLFYTGQMQNDWKVVPLSDTEYGLGYDNPINVAKADAAENGTESASVKAHSRKLKSGKTVDVKSYTRSGREGYGTIFALTDQELGQVQDIVQEYLDKVFS